MANEKSPEGAEKESVNKYNCYSSNERQYSDGTIVKVVCVVKNSRNPILIETRIKSMLKELLEKSNSRIE